MAAAVDNPDHLLGDGRLERFAFFSGRDKDNKFGNHVSELMGMAKVERWTESELENFMLYSFKCMIETQPEKLPPSPTRSFSSPTTATSAIRRPSSSKPLSLWWSWPA